MDDGTTIPAPSPAPTPLRTRLRWIERALWVIAILCLGYWGYVWLDTAWVQHRDNQALDDALSAAPADPAPTGGRPRPRPTHWGRSRRGPPRPSRPGRRWRRDRWWGASRSRGSASRR